MRHGVHRLPAEVSAKITRLMDRFGLVFAAMDMILTPDGRYVFLEINPGGQFAWLEDKTAVPLTATLADMLLAGRPI
jgi:glutathione synthase/RimK-type ligase-like ATP-grasp enzyme